MTESPGHTFDRRPAGWKLAAAVVVLAAVGYGAFAFFRPDVPTLVRRAQTQLDRGQFHQARDVAEAVLRHETDHPVALVIAGDACFALDEFDPALNYYRKVPPGPSDEAVHAQLRCGRIQMHHLGDAVAAEAHFRTALQYVPNDRNALFQLASLLGIQSRRKEAVPLILRLFRLGRFNKDFLLLLATENGALHNIKELQRYHDASPNSPAVLVGLAWHARRSKDDQRARRLLERAVDQAPGFIEARVALARLLWDTGRFSQLRRLLGGPNSDKVDDSRFWIVRGRLAERDGQSAAAVRCSWEAWRKDQTNRTAAYKLFRYFADADNQPAADALRRRIDALQTLRERFDLVTSKEHTSLLPIRRLVDQLEEVGRLWEAWGWCVLANQIAPNVRWAAERAAELHSLLPAAPLAIVCRADPALEFDLSSLPRPEWNRRTADGQASPPQTGIQVTFRDDAQTAGVTFQYFNSPSPPGSGQHMYEFNGGACAVLDYDADGWPDLYFTQGCRWPVDEQRFEHVDRLFRNLGNGRFADATRQAGLQENRFSTGATVGDFNNDGFDDLYVANIGENRLYQNRGDGTFRDVTRPAGVGDPRWSTSCVMADLNGDGWPDIYSVNYLTGPDIFQTVCKHDDGQPRMCMPFHFPAEQDQLYLSQGNGRFSNATDASGIRVPNGKGLGVVAADWQGHGRLDLFVANDTVPNFYFQNQGTEPDGTPRFEERGLPAGLALNRDGNTEGCMGIAAGDADGDGDLDLFVTNFYRETNTLYRSNAGLSFADATRESGLARSSVSTLGFGTQFLDADLDGRLDLLVTNGHIDDYRRYGRPYRMPAQLYRNTGGGRFVLIPPDHAGPYFSRNLLGRGLARLDWNRDGREDAVISHLDQPAALLTNTTEPAGNRLSLRFRAVRSSRDAVGTTVVVHTENGTLTRQLTAGDGYQASNQRSLVFGLAGADLANRIDITWPSGSTEIFQQVQANREYLTVEGTGRLFEVPVPGAR